MQLQQIDTATLVQLYEQADESNLTKKEMEDELKLRSQRNNRYSKEDLFHINKTLNHALTVFLFPISAAYHIIGNNVTIDLELTEKELIQLLKNHSANPPVKTYGFLKIKVLAKHDHTKQQINELERQGIDTSEIYDIMHL